MPRLNRTLVGGLLAPTDGELVVMDSDVPAFGVRVMPSGVRSYFVRYRVGGGRAARVRRETLGRHPLITPEKARQAAKDLLAKARVGDDPTLEKTRRRASLTVGELVAEWLEGPGKRTRRGVLKSDVSFASDRGRLQNHVVPTIGRIKLCDLRRADIEQVRDAVAGGKTATPRVKVKSRGFRHVRGGEGVATRTVACLSTLLGYALDRGYIDQNPALGVHKGQGNRNERFLSIAEIQSLTTALEVHRPKSPLGVNVLLLLLLTGCRLSEIAGLRWDEIDFDAGVIMLKASKTGARPVYLSDAAQRVLAKVARVEKSVWVFPSASGRGHYQGTPKVWLAVRTSASLVAVRIHDLRHTYASTALANGASLVSIMKLLGHSEIRTTARYAHLAADAVREAANGVGNLVMGAKE